MSNEDISISNYIGFDDDSIIDDESSFFDAKFLSHFTKEPSLPPVAYVQGPRTPSPTHEVEANEIPARQISPEPDRSSYVSIFPTSLKERYDQSVRKLAKSMRQSDATRALIQRQKRDLSTMLQDPDFEEESIFFSFERFTELEECRRKVLKTIQSS